MTASKRAVVFEPHNDDLVIGMGGTVQQLLADGWTVSSIVMTDGRYGSSELTPSETKRIRGEEKRREAERLGVDYRELELEDMQLQAHYHDPDARERIRSILVRALPDSGPLTVFVPPPSEAHPDHRATYSFVQDVCEEVDVETRVVRYLVWEVPFFTHGVDRAGTVLKVDVDDDFEEKISSIAVHESQETERGYTDLARTFNEYLAHLYPGEADRAELLSVIDSNPPLVESLECEDVTRMFHDDSGD
ncbi:hypothetical protein BRC81_14980 [Halobacteriales archaeon QS_1_68_20]|nr:MAG: hypothetical protein BRC81_14980 [Halobacteriales archaeon QS_1_68_20]